MVRSDPETIHIIENICYIWPYLFVGHMTDHVMSCDEPFQPMAYISIYFVTLHPCHTFQLKAYISIYSITLHLCHTTVTCHMSQCIVLCCVACYMLWCVMHGVWV